MLAERFIKRRYEEGKSEGKTEGQEEERKRWEEWVNDQAEWQRKKEKAEANSESFFDPQPIKPTAPQTN